MVLKLLLNILFVVSMALMVQSQLFNISNRRIYRIFEPLCDTRVNNSIREARMQCLYQNTPEEVQPLNYQCRERVGRGMNNMDFLNQMCFNFITQNQYVNCAYTAALKRYPILSALGYGVGKKKRQASSWIEDYVAGTVELCVMQHQ